jgi:hypothetical protein
MQEYEYEVNLIENERVKIKYSRKCIILVLIGALTLFIIINTIILVTFLKPSIKQITINSIFF